MPRIPTLNVGNEIFRTCSKVGEAVHNAYQNQSPLMKRELILCIHLLITCIGTIIKNFEMALSRITMVPMATSKLAYQGSEFCLVNPVRSRFTRFR